MNMKSYTQTLLSTKQKFAPFLIKKKLDDYKYLAKQTDAYQERVNSLITLYQKCGFAAASTPLTSCAYVLYTCMGIDENPEYLMVNVLQ